MNEYPSILLTFTAGLLSFFSPCVLPLIPSYLSILAGGMDNPSAENETSGKKRLYLFITTLFFILGFSLIFIVLSVIISTTFLLMGGVSKYIQIAAGIIVIILGLNFIFDFIAFLNYEKRFHITNKPKGLIGAFIAGAAFGAGWTPCIGPILTSVLFLAGQSGKTGIAVLYLALYSIGLGIPFLLAALFFDRFIITAKWFRDKMPLIKKISGALLIVIGFLIYTGQFSAVNTALQKWQNRHIDKQAPADSASRALREANIRVIDPKIKPIDFTLPLLNGGTASLSANKGKVIILNFWATWCPPCRAEMPSMETLYQRFKNEGLEILAVNLGENQATVRQFIQNNRYTFPVPLDSNNRIGAIYGVEAIPTSYILDRDGKIIARIVGSINWDTSQVIAAFDALLRSR